MTHYAMIEAGGTKFVLGIAQGPTAVIATTRVATTEPATTLAAVERWFVEAAATHGPIASLGIGSFGPIARNRDHPLWGHITATPKGGWANTDMAGRLGRALGVPVGFDTDVNAAILGEARWGAARNRKSAVYVTVGTGIGAGAIVDGRILDGLSHPEMGHMRVRRHDADHGFAGICPFHGDCLEGLASGPAIIARWGGSLSDLPPDHEAQAIIAYYLGQLVNNLQAILSPDRIILGGGVMAAPGLLDRAINAATVLGGGYFAGAPADFVTTPELGDSAGLLGALALAMDAA